MTLYCEIAWVQVGREVIRKRWVSPYGGQSQCKSHPCPKQIGRKREGPLSAGVAMGSFTLVKYNCFHRDLYTYTKPGLHLYKIHSSSECPVNANNYMFFSREGLFLQFTRGFDFLVLWFCCLNWKVAEWWACTCNYREDKPGARKWCQTKDISEAERVIVHTCFAQGRFR